MRMRRRAVLAGLSAALSFPALTAFGNSYPDSSAIRGRPPSGPVAGGAVGVSSCTPFVAGVQQCTVGLRELSLHTARQRLDQWCWAACIEAIFSMHGFAVRQEAIVDKVFGGSLDRGATGPEVVAAVDGQWIDDDNKEFRAFADVLWDSQYLFGNRNAASIAVSELSRGNALINGAAGHATVLTAIAFERDIYGNGIPIQLTVRDPWPGSPNRRILSREEMLTTMFLCRVGVRG
jgi:hypothetical protein